jgi:hypothetical protein
MPKFGELDWSELKKSKDEYEHKPSALWAASIHAPNQGVDPLKKDAGPVNKPGEVPTKPKNEEIAKAILNGWVNSPQAQWRDDEHLKKEIIDEANLAKHKRNWEENPGAVFEQMQKDSKIGDPVEEWNGREPLTKGLSEEELIKWRMSTDGN